MITYGIGILIFTTITFLFIFGKIISYIDFSSDDPDVMQGILSYVGDIGMENFQKIQTIMQFLPYLSSGGFVMILLGMWYG